MERAMFYIRNEIMKKIFITLFLSFSMYHYKIKSWKLQ